MQTNLGDKNYTFSIWNGEKLNTTLIAMDTETSVTDTPKIPDLALTTASDGKFNFIIENKRLKEFLDLHKDARLVFYNVSFDFWVIDKYLRGKHPLWQICENNKLHDYMLLDMLYRLAMNDAFPAPRNLGETSKIYAGIKIDKEDPYRMRYGEIVGKNLEDVEFGFLEYAIKDTIATYLGFISLFTKAKKLAYSYGINSENLRKFGLFTENIQVKAAICLSKITNNGISLNTNLSKEMKHEIAAEVWNIVSKLDNEYEGLFKRKKPKRGQPPTNEFELTENDIPKISRIKLSEIFTQLASTIGKTEGVKLVIPLTATGKISTSMPEWGDYIELSDFLIKWQSWSENTKALQFFSKLDKEKIHPRYNYFVRTGRTSQKEPNCVDGITEVLTPSGWVEIRKAILYKPEIMQYDDKTSELTFTQPEWIKTKSRFWLTFEGPSVNMRVTPDHRCITKSSQGISERTAEQLKNSFCNIRSGKYNICTEEENLLNERKIEFLVKCICKECYSEGDRFFMPLMRTVKFKVKAYYIRFNFIKFRLKKLRDLGVHCYRLSFKKEYIQDLLDICDNSFTLGPWIFNLYYQELVLLRKYLKLNKYRRLFPDCPWFKIISTLVDVYKPIKTQSSRLKEVLSTPEDAYCVTVPTSYFLARRNGKVFVTGNCQQIKKGRMREIVVPREKHALVSADYSFIELRTLAYIMERLFKKSVMADVIRSGKDPHAWTGAMLVNMEYEEFCSLKKKKADFYDKWRQNAKALNFGLPGGLSAPSLLNYAKNIYHIKDWTMETSATFRNKMCNEIYPELGKYLQEDSMRIMCEALGTNTEDAWERFEINSERSPFITNCIKNVVKGHPYKRDGTRYNEKFIDRIWINLCELNTNPSLSKDLENRIAGLELVKKLFWTSTITETGRVRGKVSFTQNKNTPFQGLASDGAKLAGYELLKLSYLHNFNIVNFVHDEFVFELPDLGGYVSKPLCDLLLKTMCDEMGKLTPGLPIAGEYTVAESWTKKNPNMRIEEDRIYF